MTIICSRCDGNHMRSECPTVAFRDDPEDECETLRSALKNLHDWYVEYAHINNLFNSDGSPATFHELLEARKLLYRKDES